ncbi:lipopolysaccharide biosynthesis protein [Methylovulum miyakonense]|uniref:lipopolysaccharide biosynthesis protein n=1 Tax=Methylovulum miyakonense TaxID=645578 RepID=UPI00036F6CA2|nr:oligosaccharide flippase family protein [Methylovulum miyakonense]
MGILKKLASQTAIYGLSSIFARFLNYLLVPLLTYSFSAQEYGVVSEFYAYSGFLSVLLLCGFETGYFRFRDKEETGRDTAYSTALIFTMLLNLVFFLGIFFADKQLAGMLNYAKHPEYVWWFGLILTLDAVASLPFARLRAEQKAFRFAGIKLVEIGVTVLSTLFFIVYCPKLYANNPPPWLGYVYDPAIGLGYVFIANLLASACKFLLLSPQLAGIVWGFNRHLFGRMLRYSAPMVVIGFAGIINEMLDRALLKYLLPFDFATNMQMLGVYSACYKLAMLMSLFIQAFRYAAEPFFFAYANKTDARDVYAKVLKFFVIFCVLIFLLVTLYIDVFQYFMGEEFRTGLHVVPVLLLANLFLGVYVNLSIWYKLTDRTGMGAWVSLGGAALTIGLNVWWIPLYGYEGSAWATLACYASMAAASYLLGRWFYPVPYPVMRILGYILLGISLYFAEEWLRPYLAWPWWLLSSGLLGEYLLTVALLEKRRPLHIKI